MCMTVRLLVDYRHWKRGEVVTLNITNALALLAKGHANDPSAPW
jgi:hypothetical protein